MIRRVNRVTAFAKAYLEVHNVQPDLWGRQRVRRRPCRTRGGSRTYKLRLVVQLPEAGEENEEEYGDVVAEKGRRLPNGESASGLEGMADGEAVRPTSR